MKKKLPARVLLILVAFALLGIAYAVARQAGVFHLSPKKEPVDADPWKVVEKINLFYQKESVMSQACHIKLYDPRQPGNIIEQQECVSYWGKDKVYSRIGPSETYCDSELTITADQDYKMISLMPSSKEFLVTGMPGIRQLKKMIKDTEGTLAIVDEDSREVLSYTSAFDPDIKGYFVYYNPLTYEVEQIKMEVWKDDAFLQQEPAPLIMDIWLDSIKTLTEFPAAYARDRFIKVVKDSVVLQPPYSDFQLIGR